MFERVLPCKRCTDLLLSVAATAIFFVLVFFYFFVCKTGEILYTIFFSFPLPFFEIFFGVFFVV